MAIDVIYLCSNEKWWDWESHGFASRPACIAKALADHPDVGEVLVVDRPFGQWGRILGRVRGAATRLGLSELRGGLHVLDTVRLLPREREDPVAFAVNRSLHDAQFRLTMQSACRTLGLVKPVVWLTGPYVARYADWFPESVIVYDAMDEWLADDAQASMRNHVLDAYDALRRRADIVFAVSDPLVDAFSPDVPVVRLIPNGVDLSRFVGPARPPGAMRDIPSPRVGYIGMLQDRVDVALIAELAALMPCVSFVLFGPVLDPAHFAPLAAHQNVYLPGACAHSDVAGALSAFDVCFMPHVLSEWTLNTDPLKLYEYVAAGRLTVASDLPGIRQPPELVRRARDAAGFASALAEALDGRWTVSQKVREPYLEEVTWTRRVNDMLRVVASTLEDHGARMETVSRSQGGIDEVSQAVRGGDASARRGSIHRATG